MPEEALPRVHLSSAAVDFRHKASFSLHFRNMRGIVDVEIQHWVLIS